MACDSQGPETAGCEKRQSFCAIKGQSVASNAATVTFTPHNPPTGAISNGTWGQYNNQWYYYINGDPNQYVKNKWIIYNNKYYYAKSDGYLATGWLQIGSYWYYFNTADDPWMYRDAWTPDGYYVDIGGVWIKDFTDGIQKDLSSIVSNQTLTDDQIWNRIYTVLTNIFNYGERGPRNPNIRKDGSTSTKITSKDQLKTTLTDVAANDPILQKLYNDIVDIIPVTGTNNKLSNDSSISKTVMDKLQKQINDYQLHVDRCNTCNTACNAGCEASAMGSGGGSSCTSDMYYFACGAANTGGCSSNSSSYRGGGNGWRVC